MPSTKLRKNMKKQRRHALFQMRNEWSNLRGIDGLQRGPAGRIGLSGSAIGIAQFLQRGSFRKSEWSKESVLLCCRELAKPRRADRALSPLSLGRRKRVRSLPGVMPDSNRFTVGAWPPVSASLLGLFTNTSILHAGLRSGQQTSEDKTRGWMWRWLQAHPCRARGSVTRLSSNDHALWSKSQA